MSITRFFDRLSRNDKMRAHAAKGRLSESQMARRVYRDIYYI